MGWLFSVCYQPVKTQVYLFIYHLLARKNHHSEETELLTNTWAQGLLSFKTLYIEKPGFPFLSYN